MSDDKMPKIKMCVDRVIDNKNTKGDKNKLKAVFLKDKLWSTGRIVTTLNVYFLDTPPKKFPRTKYTEAQYSSGELDPLQKKFDKYILYQTSIIDSIKKIVKERFEPIVNMKFNFVSDKRLSNIRISFKQSGSWSRIGTDSNLISLDQPTMNFQWFDVGTVIHEFGHVLGLVHEHQNPRGNQINWNLLKLYQYFGGPPNYWDPAQVMTQIVKKYSMTEINGSEYDPDSIMLYFYPPELTTDGKGTKQNFKLSKYDVYWLNKQYPFPGKDNDKIINDFYQKVYGQRISPPGVKVDPSTIIKSNTYSAENSGDNKNKNIYIVLLVVSIVILLVLIYMYIYSKKK